MTDKIDDSEQEVSVMPDVYLQEKALDDILKGACRLADAVAPNLGPNGRNTVCEQKYDIPLVVKEGKNIFPEFEIADRIENIGAVLMRDSALKTRQMTGDGTLSTAVIGRAMLAQGKKLLLAGISPIQLRKSLNRYLPLVKEAILGAAIPVEETDAADMLSVSAEDASFAALVAEAFVAVGTDGVILVEDSQESRTRLEVIDGIRYDYGYFSSAYINRAAKRDAYLEKPYVLVADCKIKNVSQIERILNEIIREDAPILIIASDMEESLQHLISENIHRRILSACVAHAPGHGETRRRNLLAIAEKTGAVLIDEMGLLELSVQGLEVCGRIGRASVRKDSTVLTGLKEEMTPALSGMLETVRRELTGAEDKNTAERLQTTLAILKGKMAVIHAGGITDPEMFERQHRMENMVSMIRSAKRHGVVPGGGKGYFRGILALQAALETVESYTDRCCIQWMTDGLAAPAKQIGENAGADGGYVVEMLMEHQEDPYYGYHAVNGQFEDLRTGGIWDAADTVAASFEIAAQTAMSLLTVSGAVI